MTRALTRPITFSLPRIGTARVVATSESCFDFEGTSYRYTGPELITNGAFNSDTSGWSEWGPGNATLNWDSGEMEVVSGASVSGAYQTFTTEIGQIYYVRAYSTVASTNHLVRVGNGASPDAGIEDSTETNSPATHEVVFTATGTTSYVYLRNSVNGTVNWDNVTARAVEECSPAADEYESLTLPDSFPATLQRNSSQYRILETGDDWLDDYTGSTVYISPSGDDTTGDGTSGNPWKTINKAVTESSDLDRISLSAGIYSTPSTITKDLAFVAPSGGVYIGTFNDLSSAQIDPSGDLWNVDNIGGAEWAGWMRTDSTYVTGARGAAFAADNTICTNYYNDGIPAIFAASSSANFSIGTSEDLPDLVTAGSVLAWNENATSGVVFSTGSVSYMGPGITIANANTTAALQIINNAYLVLDGVEVYGGTECIHCHDTATLIQFDTKIAGAQQDNIDYDDTAIGVESGVTSVWCGNGTADNVSTCHADSKVLRVGGTYRGGSRTVHDVNDTRSYVFSCTIGDARFNDKAHLLAGFSSIASETVEMDYGDITFLDTFADGGLTNTIFDTDATVVNTEPGDAWPY